MPKCKFWLGPYWECLWFHRYCWPWLSMRMQSGSPSPHAFATDLSNLQWPSVPIALPQLQLLWLWIVLFSKEFAAQLFWPAFVLPNPNSGDSARCALPPSRSSVSKARKSRRIFLQPPFDNTRCCILVRPVEKVHRKWKFWVDSGTTWEPAWPAET